MGDFQPDFACTANDIRTEALNPVQIIEGCADGVPGEAEAVFEALISAVASPDRYDIGLFVALDGGDARMGDSCLHDHLDPPLSVDPAYGDHNLDAVPDIIDGPWWDADLDACGDLESDTQAFRSLTALRFACNDSNGDGSVDIHVCTSWDNNLSTACNDLSGAIPGTSAKCGCGLIETGLSTDADTIIISSFEQK